MLIGLGDGIAFIMSIMALIYGIYLLISKKPPLYFQLIVAAIACHILGYFFDVCEYFVSGILFGGYLIGYLGSIGCFLFLLTASFGYMDGILDDKTPQMKKPRRIAMIAPALLILLFIPNLFADIPSVTKAVYALLWIPAIFNSYFSLKHAIIPDMGFGFVKAIKPFNLTALAFTFLQLIHLTLWNFCGWIPLLITGALFGASCLAMVITAEKGIKRWKI